MYCPKCGELMEEIEWYGSTELRKEVTYKCPRGYMELSLDLAKRLHEAFIARSVPPKEPVATGRSSFFWGGNWFCPACGVSMKEIQGTTAVVCPNCRGNLGPFIYHLIELHPHSPRDRWG
jgi:hypothetical protein